MQIVKTEQLVGATLVENADQKRAAVSKFLKAIETKSAQKAIRAGGLTTMALTLAACGGGSDPAPTATTPTTPVVTPPVVTPPVVTPPVTPPTVTPAAFTLTASANNLQGTAGNDTFDGAQAANANTPNTFQSFDTIDGAAGIDRIIVAQNIADTDFTNVRNVEIITTNGVIQAGNVPTSTLISLGALATKAGIVEVSSTGAFTTLTLQQGYTVQNLAATLSANASGVNNVFAAAAGANPAVQVTSNTVLLNADASGTNFRTTFVSGDVGNGTVGTVNVQREDGKDGLTGGVSKFSDEGITFASTDGTVLFDVRGLNADGSIAAGQNRGTFQQVTLGTLGNDTLGIANQTGVAQLGATGIYINAGAGNDNITGSNNADFLVGGTGNDRVTTGEGNDTVLAGDGNDTITGGIGNQSLVGGDGNDQIITGGGKDTVSGGAGNDGVQDDAAGLVTVDLGAGDDVMRFETGQFAAANAANTRDTVAGGEGTDTLWLTTNDVNAAKAPAAGETATVSGFEVIRTSGALNFKTADVQAGITSVVIDGNGSGSIEFETGKSSVQIGTEGLTVGTAVAAPGGALNNNLTVTAAGTAANDALNIVNGRTTGTDNVFGSKNITATGYEAVNINTGSAATAAQTVGIVEVNASTVTTSTSLTITGANALTGANNNPFEARTNSTGTFTVDASGLAVQAGDAVTLRVVAGPNGVVSMGTTSVIGSAGNDAISFSLGSAKYVADGGAGNDTIVGSDTNDTILGGAGNDLITANNGNDNINAGAGDDVVDVANRLTVLDTVAGGDGRDTLAVSAVVGAVDQTNVSGFEVLRLDGAFTQDMAQFLSNKSFDTVALNNVGSISVTNAAATLSNLRFDLSTGAGTTTTFATAANTAADAVAVAAGGAAGSRQINALVLTNIDTLTVNGREGGTAADELAILRLTANDLDAIAVKSSQIVTIQDVSVGTDARTIVVDGSSAAQFNFGSNGAGNGAVAAVVQTNGTVNAGDQTLSSFQLTGSAGADHLRTGAGKDVINGGAGNDTITGGLGADTINGGDGIDTYRIDDKAADSRSGAHDVVTVTANDVVDLVTAVNAVRATEVSILGNAPTAAADLLVSLNTAFGANDDNTNNVEGILFQYADGRQFLVIDSDGNGGAGNGTIDTLDTIIEIVGNVGSLALDANNNIIIS